MDAYCIIAGCVRIGSGTAKASRVDSPIHRAVRSDATVVLESGRRRRRWGSQAAGDDFAFMAFLASSPGWRAV